MAKTATAAAPAKKAMSKSQVTATLAESEKGITEVTEKSRSSTLTFVSVKGVDLL